jgi:Skp family chaperone for outer membrane proteins
MKKIVFLCSLISLLVMTALAQTPRPGGAAAAAPTGGQGAEGKIAVVNSSAFNAEILELRSRLEALGAELDPKRKEIENIAKQIEDLKTKVQAQGGTVNEQTRAQWIEQGQELEKKDKRLREDYEALVQKRMADVATPVYTKISEALSKYAQARGIAIVIDGVAAQNGQLLLYALPSTDITTDFVKEYNRSESSCQVNSVFDVEKSSE